MKQNIYKKELSYDGLRKLSDDCTFGIEIEFENSPQKELEFKLEDFLEYSDRAWELKEEATTTTLLPPDYQRQALYIENDNAYAGGEITSPILRAEVNDWLEIKNICQMIERTDGIITESCAGHIHYGLQMLEDEPIYYKNLINLWAAFEEVIMTFCSGEHEHIRPGYIVHAPLIANLVKEHHYFFDTNPGFTVQSLLYEYGLASPTNRKAINFSNISIYNQEISGTVEIRLPNGTLNPWIWQNNITFFDALINKAKNMNRKEILLIKKILSNEVVFANQFNKFSLLLDLIYQSDLQKLYAQRQFIDHGYNLEPSYQEFDQQLDNLYRVRV